MLALTIVITNDGFGNIIETSLYSHSCWLTIKYLAKS